MKAVMKLWKYQSSIGINKYSNPRGGALRALLRSYRLKEDQRKRNTYDDRHDGTLGESYTKAEMDSVIDYFWNQGTISSLRFRCIFLLEYSAISRGEDIRRLQFCDLFIRELPNEGPNKCNALVFITSNGKTNK